MVAEYLLFSWYVLCYYMFSGCLRPAWPLFIFLVFNKLECFNYESADTIDTTQLYEGGVSKDTTEYTRPGKRLHNELERSTMFHGKFHYFYGHVQ